MISLLEFNEPNKMPSKYSWKIFNKHFIFTQKNFGNLHLSDTLKY